MKYDDHLDLLLLMLLAERNERAELPQTLVEKRRLLRALLNVRPPGAIKPEMLELQDEELQRQLAEREIVALADIPPLASCPRLRLWQGDITRLAVDAIVNAANSRLLGCFIPLHNCIDNAIHSRAGMQLREECNEIMRQIGGEERTGGAQITRGWNLPAKWVIHTVGPTVNGARPTARDKSLLTSSYESCLNLACENRLSSIAFCCISTGVFRFPADEAAAIAVETARRFLADPAHKFPETVIFNVFKDSDLQIYNDILKKDE